MAIQKLLTICTLLALAACDGRPLLYSIVPSQQDMQVLALFQMIDTGNKGQLTRAETDAYFKRRFAELDRNHDGAITGDEMKSRFQARNNGGRLKPSRNADD